MTKPLSYWLVLSYRTLFALSYWAFARKRSIHKIKVYFKFCGFFAFCKGSKWQCCAVFISGFFCCGYALQAAWSLCANALRSKWQNPPSLRAVFTKTAWQSIKLNANLPLDCHEFARSRFANSRNDKTLVILSVSEVSTCKALLWGKEKHITYENPCFAIK